MTTSHRPQRPESFPTGSGRTTLGVVLGLIALGGAGNATHLSEIFVPLALLLPSTALMLWGYSRMERGSSWVLMIRTLRRWLEVAE
ncbi:hypothetical protein GCM10022631_10620 [Deinococcus rubellus]|uniref:hypothetical protein n=1 Tax=Deinococcus rubellus TaxID=1889240 RepID=UPI0031EDF098